MEAQASENHRSLRSSSSPLFLPSFAFSILLKVVEKLHVYTQQQQQSRGGDERAMIYIFLFTRMINYRRWQKPRAATAAVLFSSTFDQLGLEINRISNVQYYYK